MERDHVGERGVKVPGSRDDGVDEAVSPGGQNGVVHIARHRLGHVEADADELGAVFGDVAIRPGELVVVVLHHGSRDQPPSVLGDSDLDRALHGVELLQVGGELLGNHRILDPELRQAIGKRPEESDQLVNGNARTGQWGDGEARVREVPDAHRSRVHDGCQSGMIQRNRLIERVLSDARVGERQVKTRDWSRRMRFGGHGPDNAVSAASTPAQSPVEVRVLLPVGNPECPRPVDDLPLQDLVGRKAVPGSQGRMATTLTVASCDPHGWALTTHDLEVVLVSGRVGFESLNAGAHLYRLSRVVGAGVVFDFDILEIVHPDAETTRSSRLSIVAV